MERPELDNMWLLLDNIEKELEMIRKYIGYLDKDINFNKKPK